MNQDELDIRVLEYVYDNDRGLSGGAGLAGLNEVAGDEEAGRRTAAGLRLRGLLRDELGMAGGYHIESDGRRIVEEVRARRSDRSMRRHECREQLLRWADSDDRRARREFSGSVACDSFTMEESERAAQFLANNNLIKTRSAAQEKHFLIQITERGRECIDSGKTIQQFVSRNDLAAQMVNVFGSGNNVAASFGEGNTVSASLASFNHDMALTLALSVRDALPLLSLPDDETRVLLEQIEQGEDPSVAQRATARLYTLLADTASGGLGGVLATLAAGALGLGT